MSAVGESTSSAKKIFKARALVRCDAAPVMHGMTSDISLNNISLVVPEPLPTGHSCAIAFQIFEGQEPVAIHLQGKVTTCILNGLSGYRTFVRIVQVDPGCQATFKRLAQ